MAGHTASIPSEPGQEQGSRRAATRTPSIRTVIIISVALFILLGWLHLILALQIASTGRQLQIKSKELHKIEYHSETIRRQIAEAMAPERLDTVAEDLNYQAAQPVYLVIGQPLAETDDQKMVPGGYDPSLVTEKEEAESQTSLSSNAVAHSPGPGPETEAQP